MTPAIWYGSLTAEVGLVDSYGSLNHRKLSDVHAVRPVLSLKSETNISSGDGTETNPYIIN